MGAPALHWAIGKSRLPPYLKLTLYTLALVADAEQGFANIYLSKRQIGEFSSRGERIAAEDISDLVRFGILTVVRASAGGRTSCYQLWIDRLALWTDAHTRELRMLRLQRRKQVAKDRRQNPASSEGQPCATDQGQPCATDQGSESKKGKRTLIRGSGQPCATDQGNPDPRIRGSFLVSSPSDSTVADRGERPVHAAENSTAAGGVSPGRSPRPKDDSFYIEPPSNLRHRSSSVESESHNTRPVSSSSLGFHVLSEFGRKLLAGYGMGDIPWSEIRSELRRCAARSGLNKPDLIQQVEDSLRVQHDHFLAAQARASVPPANFHQPGKG